VTYVFDIDGTICIKQSKLDSEDYKNAVPLMDRINKVNFLYDEGHNIIYMTARGMGRSNNNPMQAIHEFYSFTMNQLNKWGCKYHNLVLGKPAADFYIDDKGVNDENFFKN